MKFKADNYENYVYMFTTKNNIPFDDTAITKDMNKKQVQNLLESIYEVNPYPCKQARIGISKELNMCERKFQIWFQNRRAREKTKNDKKPTNTMLQWIPNFNPSNFKKLKVDIASNVDNIKSSSPTSQCSPTIPIKGIKRPKQLNVDSKKMRIDFLLH